MSLAKLKVTAEQAQENDSLGGSRILESDVYDFTIDVAYIGESSGGAMSLNLQLVTSKKQEMKTTIYVSSGKAKGCKPTYTDKKTGDEVALPGFLQGNAICLLALGKELHQLETETKTISLYNYDAKKEVPTEVAMITELLKQQITIGVLKQNVDKNKKNPAFDPTKPRNKDTNPDYIPSGETRDENEIDKCFRTTDGLTTAEIRAKATVAAFKDKWLKKNKGETIMKAKGATGGNGTTAGAPAQAASSAPDLFK